MAILAKPRPIFSMSLLVLPLYIPTLIFGAEVARRDGADPEAMRGEIDRESDTASR